MSTRAILIGIGVGLVMVLLVLFSYSLTRSEPGGILPILLRAFIIYLPTGYATGAAVKRASPTVRSGMQLAPPALHAIIAGSILTVLHALLLFATNKSITPGFEWFVAEALSAILLSAVGGGFGGGTKRP